MEKETLKAISDYFVAEKVEFRGGMVHVDEMVYDIYTDEEAQELAKDSIEESLWAFSPWFLARMTDIDEVVFNALRNLDDNANEAVLALVENSCGLNDFVEEAIATDGRGHFINSYDGEEHEIEVGGETFFLYRDE